MAFSHLPPTRDIPLLKPTDLDSAQAELLAMRILVATLLWKAGGSVLVSQADIEHAAKTCVLHATPSVQGGTLWHVKEPSLASKIMGNG